MIDRSLELPTGYQHFDWYARGAPNEHGVSMNALSSLISALGDAPPTDVYLYTQHEIFFEMGVLKHTRTSPNWEGGLVTYSTCKHNMRTYKRSTWQGVWLAGLAPSHCVNNCLLFVGQVRQEFAGNYLLSQYLRESLPTVYRCKLANTNPRGDLYRSRGPLTGEDMYCHDNYVAPLRHTRSVEYYKKSAGTNLPPDGQIPKWWRDIEYLQRGIRPPSFILNPCWIFSRPLLWTTYQPKRAVLKLTPSELGMSLRKLGE